LNTKSSAKIQIKALKTWALPVVTYSYGIIKWTDTDPEGLDRLTKKTTNKIPLPPFENFYNKIISNSERRRTRFSKHSQIMQNTRKKYEEQVEIN
jgi:hypothetical protein